jgi:hypothetical protein
MSNLARQIDYGPRIADTSQVISYKVGTQAVVAQTSIITVAANQQIVIVSIVLQNETSTANVMTLYAGASAFLRVRAPNDGDGIARSNVRIPLGKGNPLALGLSAAAQCGYSIGYVVEDVTA